MARRRLLIPAAFVVAALVAASTSRPAAGIPTLDPQHLPTLPAQGLVVQRVHDILLVGLDGKPIGSLAGFAGAYTGKTYVLEALAQADPAAVLLTDAAHRAYRFDPAHSRLRRLAQMQIPLAGGATLSAHAVQQPKPYLPTIFLQVGQQRSQFLRIVGGRLVVSAKSVYDPVTGLRWPVANTEGATLGACEPAGVSGRNLIAICSAGKYPAKLYVRAYRIAPSGARTGVGPTMRWGFGAESASLSPDGRHVGITLAVGCGAPVGAITPLGAGRAGYIGNGRAVGSNAAIDSDALGWTADSKLVAHIIFHPTDCDHSPPTGIYRVDPATFARTLIYPLPASQAAWLWSA